jgi:hypothetical protein
MAGMPAAKYFRCNGVGEEEEYTSIKNCRPRWDLKLLSPMLSYLLDARK